jgi:hypothetical protein
MLAVPYFEKRLYELDDADVTPSRLVQLASEVEIDIQGIHAPTHPFTLSLTHTLMIYVCT